MLKCCLTCLSNMQCDLNNKFSATCSPQSRFSVSVIYRSHIIIWQMCKSSGVLKHDAQFWFIFTSNVIFHLFGSAILLSKHPTFLLNRTDSIHQRISCNCDDNLYYEHDCAIKDTSGIAVQTKVRNQHFRITERKRLHDPALMKSWISNCNTCGAIKSLSANTYLSTIAQTLWALPFPVSFPIWKVITISLFKCAHWSSHKKMFIVSFLCIYYPKKDEKWKRK